MDNDVDNLEDLFERDEDVDNSDQEAIETVGGGENEVNNDEDPNVNNTTDAAANVSAKIKRIIRNPRPKLDLERLRSNRGISILPDLFSKVKFKGSGYEKQDLDTMMKHLEHWAHRLYPKFMFDDVLAKLEKLGTKKNVQVCIKKLRLDIPINDFELERDNEEKEVNDEPVQADDEFDQLLNYSSSNKPRAPSPVFDNYTSVPTPRTLTEEQIQRMERNRQLAMERRRARMAESSAMETTDISATETTTEIRNENNITPDTNIEATQIDLTNDELMETQVNKIANTDIDTQIDLTNDELMETLATTFDESG